MLLSLVLKQCFCWHRCKADDEDGREEQRMLIILLYGDHTPGKSWNLTFALEIPGRSWNFNIFWEMPWYVQEFCGSIDKKVLVYE